MAETKICYCVESVEWEIESNQIIPTNALKTSIEILFNLKPLTKIAFRERKMNEKPSQFSVKYLKCTRLEIDSSQISQFFCNA